MLKVYKKVGETPLQLLERLRLKNPNLRNEKLSYAGRLDPMASGEMLILVGEENKNYKKHLNYDKEYIAVFLVGVSTDTGDILGLIQKSKLNFLTVAEIKRKIKGFRKIKKQRYPWFSAMTVDGKKLFDHYKEGNLGIERPKLSVEIKKLKFLEKSKQSKEKLKKYIFKSIKKVKGNFRQEEILNKWENFFNIAPELFQIFEIKILVSSGTYIRGLTEKFDVPICLLKLKRTKIYTN